MRIMRISPEATTPCVESTGVYAGVAFEESGEKTRSLRTSHKYDLIMVDSKIGIEPTLQQFVNRAKILCNPHAGPVAVDIITKQIRRPFSARARGGNIDQGQPQVKVVTD